jgi:glucose/arabinose dehydrogenase
MAERSGPYGVIISEVVFRSEVTLQACVVAKRRRKYVGWAALLLYGFAMGCGDGSLKTSPPASISTQLVVSGLSRPLDLEQPGDGSGRLFVVEQGGTVRIIQNGSLLPQTFLNVTSKVMVEGEMGLLGLAFHPNFRTNRKFYVNYVRNASGQFQSVIAEYMASVANPNQSDPASERILLTVDQVSNFTNHKAGQLAFGPDGFLYFGLGDGGGAGDPFGHGQNTQTLLGKMMRIDVDAISPGRQYSIPPDNPFVAGGGLPEIWAYGFRNPWRFSFDRSTNRVFVGDVGENNFEEIDLLQKGGNYGWNTMEGQHCFSPPTGCNMAGLILPIAEYSHQEGDAVIGGFVYHGSIPALRGAYIFGDLGTGKIWELQEMSPNNWTRTQLLQSGLTISSFGQDATGELYVVDFSGSVSKIVQK